MHGMAAVLAHEIKNPLAGIRGAAQLLEEALPPDEREMTQLIVRGNRPHPRPDRPHGSVRRHAQPCRASPVNIHEVLDRVRKVAETSFARGVTFIGEFRSLAAAGAGRPRPADPGVSQSGAQCRRRAAGQRRRDHADHRLSARRASSAPAVAGERAVAAAGSDGARQWLGRARRSDAAISSIPSSPPRRAARAWAWRWSPRSSAIMAA